MSVNVRKGRHYTDQNYDFTVKGLDVSAMSFHKVMQSAWKLEAMNDYGSILALSYIAAQRTFPDYNDMADNKSFLESIARSFGYHFGKRNKVRVNTISQSPTLTTAGKGVSGLMVFLNMLKKFHPWVMRLLKNVLIIQFHYFQIILGKLPFKIYITMGFSNVGVSQEIIDTLN